MNLESDKRLNIQLRLDFSSAPTGLRAALWRQWKTPRRRRAALIALGVSGELRNMARSGRGPWHLARSKALSVGLSNARFKSLGFLSLIEAR
jgi:RNA-directed DNA polymerase